MTKYIVILVGENLFDYGNVDVIMKQLWAVYGHIEDDLHNRICRMRSLFWRMKKSVNTAICVHELQAKF